MRDLQILPVWALSRSARGGVTVPIGLEDASKIARFPSFQGQGGTWKVVVGKPRNSLA